MSDEMYDTPEPAPEAGSNDSTEYWKSRAEKAELQAVERRVALRRYEVAAKHGVPADKIPEWVPAEKLDEFVGQFVASAPTEPDTPEPSTEAESPETGVPEETLAGIVNGPSHSAQGGSGEISRADWMALVNTDPAEAERLFKADKVNMSDLRQGLGPDR